MFAKMLAHRAKSEVLTDAAIHSELLSLLTSSYEAISTGAAWALWLIAGNAGIQARLRQGIEPQVAEWAVLEALRLYPPSWTLSRRVMADGVTLGDYALPLGATVMINLVTLHRDAGYWESPNDYRPERFAVTPPRFAYLPFSAGGRKCLGTGFATEELVALVQAVVGRFTLEQIGGGTPHLQLSLRPKDGLWVSLI
jgi:cytochrome P450